MKIIIYTKTRDFAIPLSFNEGKARAARKDRRRRRNIFLCGKKMLTKLTII